MKVLGIERHADMKMYLPPKKGDSCGLLLPEGTEVKRGDFIIHKKDSDLAERQSSSFVNCRSNT